MQTPSLKYRAVAHDLYGLLSGIGLEVLEMRKSDMSIREKTDFRDIVTQADHTSERRLTAYVEQAFPNDGIRGEEGARKMSQSGFEWIFDPIDGTTNYAAGLPFFGISMGKTSEGNPTLGALSFPALGEFYLAIRGEGALVVNANAFRKIHKLETPQKLRDSVIALGYHHGRIELGPLLARHCRSVLQFGSCVYEAMLVAKGQIAAMVNTGLTPFDVAGAIMIAEENGCCVTQLDGNPVDLNADRIPIIIAANSHVHEETLKLCSMY